MSLSDKSTYDEFRSHIHWMNPVEERLLRGGRCPGCRQRGCLESYGEYPGFEDVPGFEMIICANCNKIYLPDREKK